MRGEGNKYLYIITTQNEHIPSLYQAEISTGQPSTL